MEQSNETTPTAPMHARDHVELAALVCAHGPVLLHSPEPIPAVSIERYWTASKVRLDHWASELRDLIHRDGGGPLHAGSRAVLEEILVGEVLTRVWTAALSAYDKRRGSDDVEPVARSVMIGHMEARHRVLTFIAHHPQRNDARQLNGLRRRVERWTDLLVGRLVRLHDVSEFAANPERAREFARELHERSGRPGGRLVWPLLTASLRTAFQRFLAPESPSAELNARIAAAILGCFPAGTFDATGLPASLWLMQVISAADDTQLLLDDLLTPECPGPSLQLRSDIPHRVRRR